MTSPKAAAPVQEVVWLHTSFLGDLVLATAAFRLLAEKRPDIRQVLITTALGRALFKDFPHFAQIHVFDKRQASLPGSIRALRRAIGPRPPSGRRLILQAHRSFRSSFLARALPGDVICYDESNLVWGAQATVARVAVFHEAQRVMMFLESLGIAREEWTGHRPWLPSAALDRSKPWAARLAAMERPLVAVAPGSVWGTKRWPAERYADLVAKMVAEGRWQVVLLGTKDERSEAQVIKVRLGAAADQVLDLVGETSLDDLRAIYPRLSLLIANDSSPLHFASAFNTPTLAIFGATVPGLGFGPLAERRMVLEVKGLACRPCSDHGPQICPLGHFRCMKDLGVSQVWDAVTTLLS